MKSLLLTPLLISISFLNMGFMLKPKLKAVYCPSEKEYLISKSFEEKWDDYPWIYDVKTGRLYKYDDFLNQIDFMETDKAGYDSFSYKSRKIDNILKIREIQSGPYQDEDVINTYSIDLDKNVVFVSSTEKNWDGFTHDCEKIDFPKGVKINY